MSAGLAEPSRRASERYLAEAQELSQTGSFGWNTVTGAIYCLERHSESSISIGHRDARWFCSVRIQRIERRSWNTSVA